MTKATDPNGWYVIRTNTKCERKATDELRRAGVRVYLPMQTYNARNRRTGTSRVKTKALLVGYLFIRFPEGAPNWFAVRRCQGVKDVLRWFNDEFGWWEPLSIPRAVVSAYMRRQRQREFDDNVQRQKWRKETYWKGQRMLVTQGPFADFMATVERLNNNGTVEADVEIFGRMTRVSFESPDDMLRTVANQSRVA